MNKVYEEKWDRRISFYVIFYFIISAFNSVIKLLFQLSEYWWSMISVICGILIIIPMLYSINQVYKRSKRILLNSILLFLVIYLFSIFQSVLRNEPIDLILEGTALLTFAWWIPIGTFTYCVINKKILYDTLLRGSYIISILLSFPFYLYILGLLPGYNMFFSYALIFPLILHINEYFRTRNRLLLIISLLELLALLIYGARGPLLSLLIYFVFKLIDIKFIHTRILAFMTILLFTFITFLVSEKVISDFNIELSKYNIQSRTLDLFESGSILFDAGRTEIWKITYDMITEKPFLGWGLGGEYYTLGERFGDHNITNTSTPHNGILQVWVNFGLFFGSLALIIIFKDFKKIFKIKDYYLKNLLLIFFSIGIFPRLFVSSGFFVYPPAAIFIYLIIQYRKKLKLQQ